MVGTTLSHYKVIEKIGQGGMGEVYRARDTNLSRGPALPVMLTIQPQKKPVFTRFSSRDPLASKKQTPICFLFPGS